MKGIRFYEDHHTIRDKRKRIRHGEVIAALTETEGYCDFYECLSALFSEPNSEVASSHVSMHYLANCCRRISEKQAREIHPRLFERLDNV